MVFASNVWRLEPVAEIDIMVRDCSGAEIAWIGCCKRSTKRHDPKKDIAGLRTLLEPGDIGPDGEIRGFRKRIVSVSPSFTEKAIGKLAQVVADAMAETTDMTLEWYVLDIPDMLEGRLPRPLPLPEPESRREPSNPEAKEPDDGLPES